ncbi:MAG: 50S ribosomal protein L4 [Candidatus Niyogibacteria bacterium]|nr:50S ribosomal protein L4 [Candidatus Niyogibacteria bacterium]
MKATVYSQKGEKTGSLELPKEVFGLNWNANLIHQVVLALQANQRVVIAHAKGRGEVRGGGRKPWKQKGTGRARHGSTRSPIWVGGGVTHGPVKEKIYAQKLNKKMKAKAFLVSLSRKFKDNEIVFLDSFKTGPKTKEAVAVFKDLRKIEGLNKLGKQGGRALVLLPQRESDTVMAMHNLPFADVAAARNLSILDILTYKYLILSAEAVTALPTGKK